MKNFLLLATLLAALSLSAQEKRGATPIPHSEFRTPHLTRAVVVGISDYQNLPDLQYADRDAQAFATWLRSPAGGSVPAKNIRLLTNNKATGGAVNMELWWLLQESKEGDRAIIYFSGHGDMEAKMLNQLGFLLCWDSQAFAYFSGGSVQVTNLQEIVITLAQVNKTQVLLITDACRAGKLAGSSINGSGATTANLQQFSNAMKILSCQANEYSIESEQWGGGRGIFSYVLEDALYGLADRDKDSQIKLKEIRRYLDDHVPEQTDPQVQNPVVVGDLEALVAAVDEGALAQWEADKKKRQPEFSPADSRGIESLILAEADTSIRQAYQAYLAAVEAGELMTPAGKSANDYYEILIHEPSIEPMHGFLKRNFVAALVDEAQQVTNKLLKTDPQAVSDVFSTPFVFSHIPAYLHRASELLGEKHFIYQHLKAKELFFEGLAVQAGFYVDLPSDSIEIISAERLEEALNYDSNAAYVYLQLAYVYWFKFNQHEKAMKYSQKALELSPNWVVALFWAGRCHVFSSKTEAETILHRALEIDSTFLATYYELSGFYLWGSPDSEKHAFYNRKYIEKMQELIASKPDEATVFYRTLLGAELWRARRLEEAAAVLEEVQELSNHRNLFGYQYLGVVYIDMGRFEKGVENAKKIIELSPFSNEGYGQMAECYKRLNQPLKVVETLENAILILKTTTWTWSYALLAEAYRKLGRQEKVVETLGKAISLLGSTDIENQNALYLHALLGEAYQELGRKEEAKAQFQKILELLPHPNSHVEVNYIGRAHLGLGNLEAMQRTIDEGFIKFPGEVWVYYHAACLYSFAKDEKKSLEWLELALEKGFSDVNTMKYDPDLEWIREKPGFKALMKKYFPGQVKD